MGPLGVVGRKPLFGDRAHLVEGVEEVRVENLFAKCAIEPFDERILIRLSRLDVADGDALRGTPLDEGLRGERGPVIDAHASGAAVEPNEVIQDANHPRARDRRPDFDGEATCSPTLLHSG